MTRPFLRHVVDWQETPIRAIAAAIVIIAEYAFVSRRRGFGRHCKLLLVGLGLMAAATVSAADELPLADSSRRCLVCHASLHESAMTALLNSPHAALADARSPLATQGCSACHGASEAHMRPPTAGSPRARPEIVFTAHAPGNGAERNGSCLNCHQGESRMHWQGSRHDVANVGCHDCHQIHAQIDPVMVKERETQLCLSCHREQRLDTLKPYGHPLQQGEMACSDCHNAHGAFNTAALRGNTPNESCFRCHAEKRGPFLWEHPPAREDCSICHQAHGSAHAGMLKQRGPWLCQQCHLTQFHPSTAYSGSGLPTDTLPSGSTSVLGKNCLNCHAQVHGSNHPSGIRQTR